MAHWGQATTPIESQDQRPQQNQAGLDNEMHMRDTPLIQSRSFSGGGIIE
jgi:hypothetical protein